MNIKGVGMQGITNLYNKNSTKRISSEEKVSNKDTVEISTLGKTLSTYDSMKIENREKIQELKEKISNGTYNVNAKLTAKSIMNSIREGSYIYDK